MINKIFSSIQLEGIETFCPLGRSLLQGYWNILSLKSQTRKIVTIHKDFELHQVFVYHFRYQMVLILSIYLLFTKIIEIFWFRHVIDIWVLVHFEPKIQKYFKIISSPHMLNCFKHFLIYIFGTYLKKSGKKNFEIYQFYIYNFLCQND